METGFRADGAVAAAGVLGREVEARFEFDVAAVAGAVVFLLLLELMRVHDEKTRNE